MCGTKNNHSLDMVDDDTTNTKLSSDTVINLDQGDPTIFEQYWRDMGDKCTMVYMGHDSLSYFSNPKSLCWFLEPKLEEEIKRLHSKVGNAVVEDYQLVVGTGSSQLINAVLYALSSSDEPQSEPVSVVAAAPYYSYYPVIADFLRSRYYQWAGDANTFDKDGPYLEIVTSPNNPDGTIREPVVKRAAEDIQGKVAYDLAYYWPQYTPITSALNHDIMLFTASKCTGHAGSRIGWALVKDIEVAKKMIKFIEVNTIGVSRESQLRAAKLFQVISDGCEDSSSENFFQYGQRVMAGRWDRLKAALKDSKMFTLSAYPLQHCNFTGLYTEAHPAFAWIKSQQENEEDCESLFRGHKILTRSGKRFGDDPKYVRVSMVSREVEFNLFLERLSTVHSLMNGVED